MGRYSENPRLEIVSTRLSDEELQEVQTAMRDAEMNMTRFLREGALLLARMLKNAQRNAA
jgi:hypothetical protein